MSDMFSLKGKIALITGASYGIGYAIAKAASRRGAEVTLVSGQVDLKEPPYMDVVKITSAQEMFEAVTSRAPEMDIIIKAAAVAASSLAFSRSFIAAASFNSAFDVTFPVSSETHSATFLSKPLGALSPVPTAVPPRASCLRNGTEDCSIFLSCSREVIQPEIS